MMSNDQRLGNYISKNKKALLSLPKADKVSLIKKNASQPWSKDEAKKVKPSNVKASELNFIIKDLF